MVQKLKQYKMAESEKSILSPPPSCAPHFPVSKGSYFFSFLGSPSAVVIRPAVICCVLAVKYSHYHLAFQHRYDKVQADTKYIFSVPFFHTEVMNTLF